MTPTSEQVAPHMARFHDMLDVAFRRYGVPGGLPERFRDAVAAMPRHMFVHRFRLGREPLRGRIDKDALRDNDANPLGELAHIYSDAIMNHVDAAGERLPSTNSQPSYVLWLLDLLDLRPGQRVLEIGSGSGWLAAVMARLVGKDGHVTGIEIIAELAAQSRADLARLGIDNVFVLAADGTQGHAAGAPFDRVMITAASWDLPAVLFDQVTESARGYWHPSSCAAAAARSRSFRAFLGRTAAGFAIFSEGDPPVQRPLQEEPFGILNEAERSVALWSRGELFDYGGASAMQALAQAYADWTSYGLPGVAEFALEAVRIGNAPVGEAQVWPEPRGETALVWRPLPHAEDWKALLRGPP
jgi:protein-L-isoaspartate O-methyltransferase